MAFKVLCEVEVEVESCVYISFNFPNFLSSPWTVLSITLSGMLSLSCLHLASFKLVLISNFSLVLCTIL